MTEPPVTEPPVTEPPTPAWRHASDGESHWWASVGLIVAGGLHLGLPHAVVSFGSPLIVGGVFVLLGVVMAVVHPPGVDRRSRRLRIAVQILLAVIAVTNAVALAELVHSIVVAGKLAPSDLLLAGLVVWLTNVLVFGFWFWEYDRGGPADRVAAVAEQPDLLFPQMGDDLLARGWAPHFVDYLYVSLTNSIAFSPTDTLPLSRWCKVLFAAESLVSFGTIGLVAARAINVLPS